MSSKEKIAEAAITLLAQHPGATLAEIASAAGVGRATLHRHFRSRQVLIETLARDCLRALDEACAPIPFYTQAASRSFSQMLAAIMPLGARFAFLAYQPISESDPAIAATIRRQQAQTEELIDAMKAEGAIALDVPTRWFRQAFDGLTYSAWLAVQSGDLAPNDAAAFVERTLLRGLATPLVSAQPQR